MRLYKLSSILFLAAISMWAFMPQLSAKHHKRSYRSTSFALNLNFERPRVYEPVVIAPVAAAPAYVERTTYVQPYAPVAPVVQERVYYPYYQQQYQYQPVVVERPYAQRVYVHPQLSYYTAWGFSRY